jgi:hypothetical protein
MPVTAVNPTDLPFAAPGFAVCAAARAADVVMKLPGVPGEFQVRFIGTGVATMPEITRDVFDVNHAQDTVNIVWYQNKFVGRHWLLGDFEVDLADDKPSVGTIRSAGGSEFGPNTINSNDFYFDFKFKRFPFLNMKNLTPIRNTAVISAVPPIGSVFRLEKPESGGYEFRTGELRNLDKSSAPRKTIQFKQCDVVVFPDQNVGLALVSRERQSDGSYSVTVEIENPTNREATFAYFSVIHYTGVVTDSDYGFVLLKAGQKSIVTYRVSSEILDRVIDLPFFAALYVPADLQGAKSLSITFEF